MSKIPFRLRVLKALTKTLEAVPDGNGGTMEGAVFRGRIVFGDNEPLPMISVLEPPIPLEALMRNGDNQKSTGNWELLVQGFVRDDPSNPTDPAHVLMADVKAALVFEKRRERGRNAFDLAGRVVEVHIGQGVARPADDVSDRGFFWLLLTLKLVEDLADPYA